jgi:hypothetical protein
MMLSYEAYTHKKLVLLEMIICDYTVDVKRFFLHVEKFVVSKSLKLSLVIICNIFEQNSSISQIHSVYKTLVF